MVASPQTENGYTKIANELIDEGLMKINLSAYEARILWAILRKTYGWEKTEDSISVTQFEKLTGLDRRNIQRTLNGLIARNIIIKKSDSYISKYSFNKNYEEWDFKRLGKHKTIVKGDYTQTVVKGDYRGASRGTTELASRGTTTKEKRKYTKERAQQADEVYNSYPRKADKNNSIKSIEKLLKSGESKETLLRAVKNYKMQIESKETEREYIIQSNNFFGKAARYKEFVGTASEEKRLNPIEAAMQRCIEKGDY